MWERRNGAMEQSIAITSMARADDEQITAYLADKKEPPIFTEAE